MSYDIRVHGNGFLQLDLGGDRRLHVWDPRIPRQRVDTSIHNHVFSFESKVLLGAMLDTTMQPIKVDKHHQFVGRWPHQLEVLGPHTLTGELQPNVFTESVRMATHMMYQAVPRAGADTRLECVDDTGLYFEDCYTRLVAATGPVGLYSVWAGEFHRSTPLGTTVTVMSKKGERSGRPYVACPIDQTPDNDWDRYKALADVPVDLIELAETWAKRVA